MLVSPWGWLIAAGCWIGCVDCVSGGCLSAVEMQLSIAERIPFMADWTAPWTRLCRLAPFVTCGRLTVLALVPCWALTSAVVEVTGAIVPVSAELRLVETGEGVDIFSSTRLVVECFSGSARFLATQTTT